MHQLITIVCMCFDLFYSFFLLISFRPSKSHHQLSEQWKDVETQVSSNGNTWHIEFNTKAVCRFKCLLSSFLPENDNFLVWEMFPGKDAPIVSDSEEEKDFYFSDDEWLHDKSPDLFLKNKVKLQFTETQCSRGAVIPFFLIPSVIKGHHGLKCVCCKY